MLRVSVVRVRNWFAIDSRRSALPVLLSVVTWACGCASPDEPRVAQQAKPEPPPIAIPDAHEDESEPVRPQTADEANSENGGDPNARSRSTEPSESGSRESVPNASEAESPRPLRPIDDWVIFREAYRPSEDATCETHWVGRNQFEVRTENVQRVTVDMSKVPEGAPRKGPWIIRMDGQAIELTGFNPKPGYTGLKRDLIRSKNGQWSVDRTRLYRSGT
ncbi:MAG: hypothetical protein KF841_13340 [Phycisphaerae bacterium]|nr:hypothetical protein [Phycisphaerae bacterium]